jgi:hypothetical protein
MHMRVARVVAITATGLLATPIEAVMVLQVNTDGHVELRDAQDALTRAEFRQWDLSGVRFRIAQ